MVDNYTIYSIYNIAKADFLQRVRSYYFLIALGVCIFLIYSFVPALDAGYTMVSLGNYRGYYNSAWIGSMVANCVPFFALIGFYVVNYSVERDIDTGVGQIIATTKVSRLQYLTGKFLSNFSVLMVMMMVVAVMTIAMFMIRGETSHMEIEELLTPLLFITIPTMFIIASIALFFDSLSNLSRGMKNILYFFLWIFLIGSSQLNPFMDVLSTNTTLAEIKNSISSIHPDWNSEAGTGIMLRDSTENIKIFTWDGINWSISFLLQRFFWMFASFGIVLIASLGFNRFDTSKIKKQRTSRFSRINPPRIEDKVIQSQLKFADIPLPENKFSFLNLVLAEIRLMAKGNTTLWLIITAVLFLTSTIAPINFAYKIILPLLWFFQTLILSKLGSRETTNRCNEYIFSSVSPLLRQLPAMFLAASFLMLLLSLPVALRLLLAHDLYSVYAIIVGSLFIPSFAIASGIITGGSKLFEVIFTIIVYGYFNNVYFFDFTGAISESHEFGVAHYIFAITLVLVILALIIRKRQISHI